ncbi:L-threonylcarbamoyladenylate synthase [Streptomyces apocyni]|uniref:L-threonylcarbamoyladenylate synthase n=1 Tax=Streptomyces apocyni TaxID=2654677 RepID=UPI0018D1BC7E|nr:Sua5/YciO/YrdC/YwlC family protein [Streptomyces apocyni]
MTRIVRFDDTQSLVSAADRLRRGALVIAPTDLGYGLFCDPFNDVATGRLRAARPRPTDTPLSLLVSAPTEWRRWAYAPDHPGLQGLLDETWPGPLNIVALARPVLPACLVSDEGTVAVIHNSCRTLNLLSLYSGLPLAAASANVGTSDGTKSTDLAVIRTALGAAADLIVEDAEDEVRGIRPASSSTVVSVAGPRARVVREGAVGTDVLRQHLPGLESPASV